MIRVPTAAEIAKLKQSPGLFREAAPFYDPERDGVTFSVLSGWRNCRQLTAYSLGGITPRFSGPATIFGSVWHELMHWIYEDVRNGVLRNVPTNARLSDYLTRVEKLWKEENPIPSADTKQQFESMMGLIEPLLSIYCRHWSSDFKRKWLKLESEFKFPMEVTHANTRVYRTFLRGKIDGVFDQKGLSVFETKTKSRLNEDVMGDWLPIELQLNIYLNAVRRTFNRVPRRVQYNIVRRPGLRQTKRETTKAFYQRVLRDIEKRPDWYFIRMRVDVSQKELDAFDMKLYSIVAEFCAWWYGHAEHYHNDAHCENKYGTCWALPICSRNERAHTFVRDKVFRELGEIL